MDDEEFLKAYAEGYKAWRSGKKEQQNPYNTDDQWLLYLSWRYGYIEAELDVDDEDE